MKEVAHHAHALGGVHEVGLEANQSAHGHKRLDGDDVADVVHVGDLGFAAREIFHDVAQAVVGHFDEEFLDGFHRLTVGAFLPKHFGA